MTAEDLRKEVEIKELELNALLEITQAINSNLPAIVQPMAANSNS